MKPDPTKTGKQAVGGGKKRKSERKVEFKARELLSVEQGYPARLTWGKTRLAGDVMTPVFNFRKVPIETEGGKGQDKGGGGSGTTRYNRYGSYAVFLFLGRCKKLIEIKNGDTRIWNGPIDDSSEDANGRTILNTTIGEIRFYWGGSAQVADSVLAGMTINGGDGAALALISAMKHCCYAVMNDVAFGEQDEQPTLHFITNKWSTLLTLSQHDIEGGSVMPEVIYAFLNNRLWGAGIDAAYLNAASFEAAGETTITEETGFAPVIEEFGSGREIIGDLLEYIDGLLYFKNGKFEMKLLRKESLAGIITIDEDDLLEEPRPTNTQYDDTWSETRVSYQDRNNEWADETEVFYDEANAEITGERRAKSLAMPFITTQKVAKKIAKRKGHRNGLPQVGYQVVVKPSIVLYPGDLFYLSYVALGITNRVFRVMKVTRGGPLSPEVTIEGIEKPNLAVADDYEPGIDYNAFSPTIDATGAGTFAITSATIRLAILPSALKEGYADGFLVVMNRTDPAVSFHRTFFSFNPAVQAYQQMELGNNFPVAGTILFWQRSRSGTAIHLRMQFNATDAETVSGMTGTGYSVLGVTGKRTYKSVGYALDRHEVSSMWHRQAANGLFQAFSSVIYDFEFVPGEFATSVPTAETHNAPGIFPAASAYAGTLEQFTLVRSNDIQFERSGGNAPLTSGGVDNDAARIRYVKVTLGNQAQEQAVADVTAAEYQRITTTMSPEGTYVPDWGARARIGAEIFDTSSGQKFDGVSDADYSKITDIDDGLGAIFDGTRTETQYVLGEDSDKIIGKMVEAGTLVYNDA